MTPLSVVSACQNARSFVEVLHRHFHQCVIVFGSAPRNEFVRDDLGPVSASDPSQGALTPFDHSVCGRTTAISKPERPADFQRSPQSRKRGRLAHFCQGKEANRDTLLHGTRADSPLRRQPACRLQGMPAENQKRALSDGSFYSSRRKSFTSSWLAMTPEKSLGLNAPVSKANTLLALSSSSGLKIKQ